MERVEREALLAAPPDQIWRALTEDLSTWFGAEVAIDLRVGGSAEFVWPDGRVRAAVVEEVEPGARLAFRWLAFERGPDGVPRAAPPTRVVLTLEPSGEGTRLGVVEAPMVRAEAMA